MYVLGDPRTRGPSIGKRNASEMLGGFSLPPYSSTTRFVYPTAWDSTAIWYVSDYIFSFYYVLRHPYRICLTSVKHCYLSRPLHWLPKRSGWALSVAVQPCQSLASKRSFSYLPDGPSPCPEVLCRVAVIIRSRVMASQKSTAPLAVAGGLWLSKFTWLHAFLGGVVHSIIFIHGLFGHPEKTWTGIKFGSKLLQRELSIPSSRDVCSSGTKEAGNDNAVESSDPGSHGIFWPATLLPEVIPNTRIWTWGYDADIDGFWSSASQNTVSQHATNLLSDVADLIESKDYNLPIIFVVHSLGGLIVKAVRLP